MTRAYATPGSLKDAIEQRLKRDGVAGFVLQRRRQRVIFERFLARIERIFGGNTILKGGLALEIRLAKARSTGDIALALFGSQATLLEKLQAAGQIDLGDFMTFEVQDSKQPDVTGDGVIYGGKRYRVECKLAGKVYGGRFGLDIVFGGAMLGAATVKQGGDFLGFAGIEAPMLRLLPMETHVAEKLHAYTLPRTSPNDRVRDLPDMALLATSDEVLVATRLREALEQTFAFRGTHLVPRTLGAPPAHWRAPYAELAREQRLPWQDIDELVDVVERFLNPVLSGPDHGTWDRTAWAWIADR